MSTSANTTGLLDQSECLSGPPGCMIGRDTSQNSPVYPGGDVCKQRGSVWWFINRHFVYKCCFGSEPRASDDASVCFSVCVLSKYVCVCVSMCACVCVCVCVCYSSAYLGRAEVYVCPLPNRDRKMDRQTDRQTESGWFIFSQKTLPDARPQASK